MIAFAIPQDSVAQAAELAQQVEIRRTEYGIPHVDAENMKAAGYAMGYAQMEDYAPTVVHALVRARGELGMHFGPDSTQSDFVSRRARARAIETYHLLEQDTRDVMEGFATGVNRYIELHPEELAEHIRPDFTGHDIHAFGIRTAQPSNARRFLERLDAGLPLEAEPVTDAEDGSNAWAIGPSRTRSGEAILLRNPHLSWTAGYYEAHVTVPGKLNFYGDFRIGGPLGIIGGFNQHLGWATTNNAPDLDEIYALSVDPQRPDHYLFDGGSVPLTEERVTVEFRNGEGVGRETKSFWNTPLGPVIHRENGRIYVLRQAGDGEFRTDEQFLKMMKSGSLKEWKAAVAMRARVSSNLTYADAAGNIFYIWNATIPALPHASGGDSLAVPATRTSQVWRQPVALDSMPQLLNPAGGYVHNENDPPYFTNLNEPLDPSRFPAYFPENRLRLRSQLSLELLHGEGKVTLEDVVRMKHSMRMLLADRVKPDLVDAVRAARPEPEVAQAITLIEAWDNTVAAESRGGVLFQMWWERYEAGAPGAPANAAAAGFSAPADALFQEPWTSERPVTTPRGLADPQRAAAAFAWAVDETRRRYGAWDVAWGEVHRVRRGEVDVPVGGCSGLLGCFRVLSFREAEDGKQVAVGGDGWVLAVEFTDPIRAYSVLAYGQSNQEDSPHYADQADLFARNEMKRVAFTEKEIRDQLIRRYRPGLRADAER